MSNDAVLIQQATGPHAYLLNLTVKEHAAYCLRHGFDYWPTYGNPLTGKDAHRHAFWGKVALLLRAVEAGYQHVVWLDSDCYIADDDRDLREACPANGIGMTWHDNPNWPDPSCYDHFNCGAVYVGVGVDSERLLKAWWHADDEGHSWHDQHAFNKNAIKNFVKLWKSVPTVVPLGHEWNATPFYPHDNPVVMAWHGCSDLEHRMEMMQAFIQGNGLRRMLAHCSKEEAEQKALYCESVGNLDVAIQFWQRAQELGAEGADFLRSFANTLIHAKRWGDAVPLLLQATELSPSDGVLWRMLSGCYDFLGEHEENRKAIVQSERFSPGAPGVMLNGAFWELRHGYWQEGFRKLRWDFIHGGRRMRYPYPEWHGVTLDPWKLFVWAEQGLGDTLMLSRFVPRLCADHIVFEVQKPLVALLSAQRWSGVEIVAQTEDQSIRFEFAEHIGTFSLPAVFGITPRMEPELPYIKAPAPHADAWSKRIGSDAFKIGFSWAGGAAHANNVNRNAEAALFDALVQTPGTRWFSLQRDIVIPEEAKASTPEVTWIGDDFADMADAAGAIANLDLVITIDSAMAHLAGAMGKPVWVLLSKSSDWRWLLDKEDTPWYSSMRLFRQEKLGEWAPVMARIQTELEALLNGRSD